MTKVLTIALSVLLLSCNTGEKPASRTSSLVSTTLASFEVATPARAVENAGSRALAVAKVLLGRDDLPAAPFLSAFQNNSGETAPWQASLEEIGRVGIWYQAESDDLRLFNFDVMEDIAASNDIGEAAARQEMVAMFAKMAAAGVINGADFDTSKARLGFAKFGIASGGTAANEIVTEYRYSLLRQINGIDFANAGLRIAIHRTGRVASIRVGGAQVSSLRDGVGMEQPLGSGRRFARGVPNEVIEARFTRDVPNARRIRSEVMYILPDGVRSALLEPMQTYTFSRVFVSDASVIG